MFHGIYIINFIIILEVLIAEHIFAHYLTLRSGYSRRFMLSSSLCLFTALLLPAPMSLLYGCFLYLFLFFLSGCAIAFCYQESFWTILFCCVTGYTIHHLAYILNDFVTSLFYFLGIDPPVIPTYVCTVVPPFLLCYHFFAKVIKKYRKIQVDNKKMLVLSGIAVLVDVFVGLSVASIPSSDLRSRYILVIDVVVIISCIMILCMQFSLLTNKKLESDLHIMEQLLKDEKKQYHISKENIQLINLKCHDLKYQLRKIRRNENEIDRNELENIENAIGIYDSIVSTNNDALDIILTEKSLICEKENITLTCMADGEKLNFMSPTDIYSLFGNALDNAIEAVCKLTDHSFRNISVNIKIRNKFLAIRVENYFEGTLKFCEGLPVTSKNNTNYHGYGIKSMRMIAEKYQGYLTADADKQLFCLNIMIPILESSL